MCLQNVKVIFHKMDIECLSLAVIYHDKYIHLDFPGEMI